MPARRKYRERDSRYPARDESRIALRIATRTFRPLTLTPSAG